MASFTNVNTLLGPEKFYAIPDYQREYAWENDEIADFWVDVKGMFESENNTKHFFGAIVISKYGSDESNLLEVSPSTFGIPDNEVSHLIDGQQRLTTLMIFLSEVINSIHNDELINDVQKGIYEDKFNSLLVDQSRMSGGDSAPKLFTKERSGAAFTEKVLGIHPYNQVDMRYKAAKNVDKAINYFNEELASLRKEYLENGNTADAFYGQLFQVITARAQFCVIDCSGDMDEFQVFESLNGKGINLSAVDRIKNIYLSYARSSVQGSVATKNWDLIFDELVIIRDGNEENWILHFFISFFFEIDNERRAKAKLAKRFKEYILSAESYSSAHQQLISSAKHYGKLRRASVDNQISKGILEEIRCLDQEQIYVPLLFFANKFGIESDEFAQIAQALLIFIVRYTVCKKPTNALDGIFSALFSVAEDSSEGLSAAERVISFITQKQEGNEDFKKNFACFTTNNRSTAYYLLKKLEHYYKIQDGDVSPSPSGQTLEHIMPRKIKFEEWYGEYPPIDSTQASFTEDYIQHIGNMAILSAEDNSSANNKNYEAKRRVYKNGNGTARYGTPYDTFKLIHMLYDEYPDVFTHEQVELRAIEFSKVVCEIWPKCE